MLITGNAYIETNEPAAAVEVFQSLLAKNKTDNTTSYNDAASYYLALAFLKNKNYAAAAGLMQQIQADKENAYSTKFSTEYIDRVKKLAAK
jgi:predicted PolB exonuclease-like 3'-5' exonuclease